MNTVLPLISAIVSLVFAAAVLDQFFARLERRNYRVHVRVLLARYRAYDGCPDCRGSRLKPAASRVRIQGCTISDLSSRSIEELVAWLLEEVI